MSLYMYKIVVFRLPYLKTSQTYNSLDFFEGEELSVLKKFLKGFIKKTLKDLHVRTQFHVNIVGIKSRVATVNDDGEIKYTIEMTDVPDPHYPLEKDDLLVIAGTDDNLKKFIRMGEIDA